jgi:hypothetical protein
VSRAPDVEVGSRYPHGGETDERVKPSHPVRSKIVIARSNATKQSSL